MTCKTCGKKQPDSHLNDKSGWIVLKNGCALWRFGQTGCLMAQEQEERNEANDDNAQGKDEHYRNA